MILVEGNDSVIIDHRNSLVYIITTSDFLTKHNIDAANMPTQIIQSPEGELEDYVIFCTKDPEYELAKQYAKEQRVANFNKQAEETLKSVNLPIWADIKPTVDTYIAENKDKIKTIKASDYVYNLIDSLTADLNAPDYDVLAEDYYLNMIYSYEPFTAELDKAIYESKETYTKNKEPVAEAVSDKDSLRAFLNKYVTTIDATIGIKTPVRDFPRGCYFKAGPTGSRGLMDHGIVHWKGQDYVFYVQKTGYIKIMTDQEAGSNWSETIFKEAKTTDTMQSILNRAKRYIKIKETDAE